MSNNQLKKFSSEHLNCLINSQKSRSGRNELSFDSIHSTSQASLSLSVRVLLFLFV
jgi:hypothetical protein